MNAWEGLKIICLVFVFLLVVLFLTIPRMPLSETVDSQFKIFHLPSFYKNEKSTFISSAEKPISSIERGRAIKNYLYRKKILFIQSDNRINYTLIGKEGKNLLHTDYVSATVLANAYTAQKHNSTYIYFPADRVCKTNDGVDLVRKRANNEYI